MTAAERDLVAPHCEVEVMPAIEHLQQPAEDRPKFICGQLLVDGQCPVHG